ncbi:hypothetical protein GCM10009682_44560 [Luedemannella flava]|uniref:Uncharacterized protein n=1 Tax=Luedemannella flava TaxID=349316 RepID=A0ABN2MEE2_9ACTN
MGDRVLPGGKKVIGGGAEVSGGGGEVLLTGMYPLNTAVYADAHEDQWSSTTMWSLKVHAICADPLPGREYVSERSITARFDKGTTVVCPAGKSVVGSGVLVYPNGGLVSIQTLNPGSYNGSEFVAVRGAVDDPAYIDSWRIDGVRHLRQDVGRRVAAMSRP